MEYRVIPVSLIPGNQVLEYRVIQVLEFQLDQVLESQVALVLELQEWDIQDIRVLEYLDHQVFPEDLVLEHLALVTQVHLVLEYLVKLE